MTEILGQLFIGLINGSFYALLSLGLAIIFGMLNIVNFAHGAIYMLGAFLGWIGLTQLSVWTGINGLKINYWLALLIVPVIVGFLGAGFERSLLRRLRKADPVYGMLLTYGLALVLEGGFRHQYGVSGQPYEIPEAFRGAINFGFMFLPKYRLSVVLVSLAVCAAAWYLIERTRIGGYLRAGTENPVIAQSLGINVPMLVSLTYGVGVALAALTGVLAAPILQVSSQMGSELNIIIFAVVVVGGMGSITGAIITGITLGLVQAVATLVYPEASSIVIFILMSVVLFFRPAGLFGREA
ncbi:branched-chain amino acid ABC transporter permease [Paraburkholderia sp. CNPSo 3157]|uniref:Branched-chain amino acid ABC transporter permease n=1 Tax=Paraburkholderia franconis TaxID=2654983 RepID=A0A7X1NC46_9BURK|nr:branched-chain amino acid ABC transporter permease [Paraburkholderia franconis]MPW19252.1 branched-chain amino acid ABC transporter permease [Paraburkholderia franconis]